MATLSGKNIVFSVSSDLVLTESVLPYDLYINSSSRPGYERFVCIFKQGRILSMRELLEIKSRFHNIYVRENDRGHFVKALSIRPDLKELPKAAIIRDSAIHYLSNIFSRDQELTNEVLNQTVEGCKEVVESMVDVVKNSRVDTIQNLISKLSFHDFYTYDHSINVSMYCVSIYKILFPEATDRDLVAAGLGGLLHDVGKIHVPNEIINSPYDKLSDEEYRVIRKHPGHGLNLMSADNVQVYGLNKAPVIQAIYQHHENFDGSGYPNQVAGENIHVMARIVAIADFLDAITTQRSYHKAMDVVEALHVMMKSSGKKLDPRMFDTVSRTILKSHHHHIDHQYDKCLHHHFDPCQPCEHLPIVKNYKDRPHFRPSA